MLPVVSDLRTAIGFLTRIPIGTGSKPVSMGSAAPWFPLVGVLIGLVQGAVLLAVAQVLPPLPSAVVAVAAGALITGAFHHDGLADMADAFGGGWTVEQRMVILKDSRLGTYGTSALILSFATEIAVLASLSAPRGFAALVAAHGLSRAIAVAVMHRAPLAGDGMGAAYAAELGTSGAAVAVLFGVIVAAVAFAGTWLAIPAVVLAALSAVAVVILAVRKIGGVTGDVLGAVQQVAALSVLLVAATAV